LWHIKGRTSPDPTEQNCATDTAENFQRNSSQRSGISLPEEPVPTNNLHQTICVEVSSINHTESQVRQHGRNRQKDDFYVFLWAASRILLDALSSQREAM
jgi:hypothetical protein